MESFVSLLKIFSEKHLLPAVGSAVVAAIVLLLLPSDHYIIQRIGDVGCFLLIAGVIFLVIHFLKRLKQQIQEKIFLNGEKLKWEMENERETMEKLWSAVDDLNPVDRELVKKLLKMENKTIELSGNISYSYDSIFSSNIWLDTRQVKKENHMIVEQIKLKENIYQSLKYSMNKYSRICHFED